MAKLILTKKTGKIVFKPLPPVKVQKIKLVPGKNYTPKNIDNIV